MTKSNKSLFELTGELSKYPEGSAQHKYYSEQIEKRKSLLKLFWDPYFQEIKEKTIGIQEILKDNWYENVDLLLKSLIIDWIKFFLNLNYKIRVDDSIRFDDYFLWLFNSLKININNKELLQDILSELESWWENLPESPLELLINYDYSKLHKKQHSKPKDNNIPQENIRTSKKDELELIIGDFRSKDYGFIKDLRTIWVGEDKLEYTFLKWLHRDICDLLDGKKINQWSIDKIFNYYNIDVNNKKLLKLLKEKIEIRLDEVSNMPWHCAYDDSPHNLKLYWENVVIYNVWDEYIPHDNHCSSIELLRKVNSSSDDELEKMYIKKEGKEWESFLDVLRKR